MGAKASKRFVRDQARKRLQELLTRPGSLNIIHYSCESFYDNPSGKSRRITSIAVLNARSDQTVSFSIHQQSEIRDKSVCRDHISQSYDEFERSMLEQFYQFVEGNPDHHWLHWNMRDANYGFPALEHRAKVLNVQPIHIPQSHLFDLADALIDIYGSDYARHPRLENLADLNEISRKDFLTGPEEATAFENREYIKLHQSTLRKVQIIFTVAQSEANGTLKTSAGFWEAHGSSLAGLVEEATDSWMYKLLGGIALILTLSGLLLKFL